MIGLVTLFTPNIAKYATIPFNQKEWYAKKHGHNFYGHKQILDDSRAPHWSKILALQAALSECDWLFWSDADSIIMDVDRSLETLLEQCNHNGLSFVIATRDYHGFNSGNFFIRNIPEAHAYLRDVWVDNANRFPFDQRSMKRVFRQEKYSGALQIVPQNLFNSYPAIPPGKTSWKTIGRYKPGDFMIHTPGGNAARKAVGLKRLAKQLVKENKMPKELLSV